MIRSLLVVAAVLAGVGTAPSLSLSSPAQVEANSLSNFRALDVSPTELRVVVVYSYDGARGPDHVTVTASAIQANGVAVRGLVNDVTRAVARLGTGKALTVLRMESPGPPARSTQVEVCLNHRFSGDIICRTFPHVRRWGGENPTPQPPPTAPPPSPSSGAGTCTVMGDVSGPLRWSSSGNRGGRQVTVHSTLREMVMTAREGARFTAPITNGRYAFSGIPAGRIYFVDAGRFRSSPPSRRIDCRANVTFRNVDFRIIGGPRD